MKELYDIVFVGNTSIDKKLCVNHKYVEVIGGSAFNSYCSTLKNKSKQNNKIFSNTFELEKFKDIDCTEENKQEVKKVRTSINNTLKVFEDKRKEIKAQVLEAYNQFNDKYEQEVKTKLENASNDLKMKIDYIEAQQLAEKDVELGNFIEEHIKANHLENILKDVAEVVRLANLKVNLSSSIKSLKEGALAFIQRVANEVKLIELEETPSNLLYEYQQNGFDLTKAKLTLIERQRQIEELAKQREQVQEVQKVEEKIVVQVEEIVAPKEIVEEQQLLTVTFTITDTKENIIKVREFMKEMGIKYE